MSDTQTIGGFDRDEEDQDIAREKVVNTGEPKKHAGSVLDQLRAKFAGLDDQRTQVFRHTLRNGTPIWVELDTDITEDEVQSYRDQAKVGNRAARRNGQADSSNALYAAALINGKNTRLWFEDPQAGGEPLTDLDGDPLTVHSKEWLEALSLPADQPLEGLREVFGDPRLVSLSGEYQEIAMGDGATAVNPTRGRSGA